MRTLLQRRGRVQARDRLLNDVWGYESVIDTRTVDTHVRRLREKLGKAGDAIETVRSFRLSIPGRIAAMSWILLGLLAGSTIVLGYVVWRNWIAPWRKIEELIDGIGQARKPRTFLSGGGTDTATRGSRRWRKFLIASNN